MILLFHFNFSNSKDGKELLIYVITFEFVLL